MYIRTPWHHDICHNDTKQQCKKWSPEQWLLNEGLLILAPNIYLANLAVILQSAKLHTYVWDNHFQGFKLYISPVRWSLSMPWDKESILVRNFGVNLLPLLCKLGLFSTQG